MGDREHRRVLKKAIEIKYIDVYQESSSDILVEVGNNRGRHISWL